MCITTYQDNSHWAKLANQGVPGIWVGFAEAHQGLDDEKELKMVYEKMLALNNDDSNKII